MAADNPHAMPEGNGREHASGAQQSPPEPRLIEDESGVTLDSGVSACRFDPQHGGRLVSWQWRTVPTATAASPATRHAGPRTLDLVVPGQDALIDHFLPLGSRPEEFANNRHREFGDFVDQPYRSQAVDSGGELRIGLLRDGAIRAGKRVAEVRMAKSAAVRPGSGDLAVLYRVINSSMRPMQILFAVELNLFAPGLSAGHSQAGQEGYYLVDGNRPDDASLESGGVSPAATHVALVNPGGEMALQLGWDWEADLWRMPPLGGGPGVRLLVVWKLMLPPRDNWAMGMWLAPS